MPRPYRDPMRFFVFADRLWLQARPRLLRGEEAFWLLLDRLTQRRP